MNRAALLVLIICCACAQVKEENHESEIDALVAESIKPASAGLSVAVAREGEILFSKGYGSANAEYDIPNTPATIFHIASVSKQFTAFAIALLDDEGKLSLNDDIRKYLPELPDFGHTITIKHLVHHTSGLRDQWNLLALAGWRLDDVITRDHVLRLMSHQQDLNFKPGDEFAYCNTGYTLMAEIVSRVTGKPFAEWCSENIFQPLEMDNTLFYDDHEKLVKNRAYSYYESPSGVKKSVLSYANVGATSLFTSVEDLTKWSNNFYRMKVGNKRVMEQMEECAVLNTGDTISYAFGQGISKHKGVRLIAHDGADAGYRTTLLRFPEQKYSVVVLSNLGSFSPGKFALQVADIYLKEYLKAEPEKPDTKKEVSSPVKVNEDQLKRYEGDYQLTPEMVVNIRLENGKLIGKATGQPPITLVATSQVEFTAKEIQGRIAFHKDVDGTVNRFTLYQGGQEKIAGRTKPFDPGSITDLAQYTGTFYSPELETSYTVKVEDSILVAHHIRHDPAAMTPVGRDSFSTHKWFMSRIHFTRNEKDEITGFRVSSGRVRNVKFVRR